MTDLNALAVELQLKAEAAKSTVYDAAYELAHDYVSPDEPKAEERLAEFAYLVSKLANFLLEPKTPTCSRDEAIAQANERFADIRQSFEADHGKEVFNAADLVSLADDLVEEIEEEYGLRLSVAETENGVEFK